MVFLVFPFASMKGGRPTKSSYIKHPNAQRSDYPEQIFLWKNSGGKYSKVPKNVVVETFFPSLLVDILVTLDEETDELEEASSAIDRSE